MRTLIPSPLLRQALLLDAAGSAPMMLLHLLATGPLSAATQLPPALLQASGVAMLGWVALLLGLRSAPRPPRAALLGVVWGNRLWALGALACGWTLAPPAAGWALLAVHALAVLAFAALQAAGLRRSAEGGAQPAPG